LVNEKTIEQLIQLRKKLSALQGQCGLVTVWMRIAQGRVVLLMSMIRNEDDDDDVGGTEKRNLSMMIEKKNADIFEQNPVKVIRSFQLDFTTTIDALNMLSIRSFSSYSFIL
jgi:hypothetical protein